MVSAATWISPGQGVETFDEPSACPRKADLVSIANVPASNRARCFGARTITITGYVPEPYDACDVCRVRSFSLSPRNGPYFLRFEIYPTSALGRDVTPWLTLIGHRVRITGRFNDTTAKRCTARDVEPPADQPADPIAICRSRFVALRITDLGKP
jgi:hypothetical protein